jgi:hypothetical protein
MVSYLTDTDKVEAYNGTDWVSVAPTTSQGLTLINTTSFSGVASVSAPASTFSATYENYRIVLSCSVTLSSLLQLRLRANGIDNTAATYNFNTTAAAADNAHTQTSSQTALTFTYFTSSNNRSFAFDVMRPFLAANTFFYGNGYQSNALLSFGGEKVDTNVYDSITLLASTGNISGIMSVYGYNL